MYNGAGESIHIHQDGASWSVDNPTVLYILDVTGKTVATYNGFAAVKFVEKAEDELKANLEEALELISLVDSGKFTNQDVDWKERAEALLDN